jgi:cold shock CspA family protein
MGRSQETSGKKEIRNKKEKKRKDKEKKRALRKQEGKSSFDDMIAYVDEFGRISSTPPSPDEKTEVIAEDIELTVSSRKQEDASAFLKKGVVTFFNNSKGFGFIRDNASGMRYFVHANALLEPISENDTVIFETAKGIKGPSAVKVKIFREENPPAKE